MDGNGVIVLTFLVYGAIVVIGPLLMYFSLSLRDLVLSRFGIVGVSALLSIPLMLRGFTGTDSLQYYTLYQYGSYLWERENSIERGYSFLMDASHAMRLSAYGFFFVIAFLTICMFMITLNTVKGCINIYASCFYFITCFYFNMFNISRQMLAVSFVIFGLVLLSKDNIIPSIICFAVGSLMHVSAVIAFLSIAIYYLLKKCNNKVVVSVTLLIVLVFIFNRRLLADFAGMLFNTVYYSGYFAAETVTTRRIISKMIINAPLILLLLLNLKRKRDVRFLSLVALVGIFLTTMGDATGRIGLNFSAVGIVAYGMALQEDVVFNAGRSSIRKEPLTVLFLLYCFAIFMMNTVFGHYGEVIPYMPFFPPQPA